MRIKYKKLKCKSCEKRLRKSFKEADVEEIKHLCKRHYGTDKGNPPNLPDDNYIWNNNFTSNDYGWIETDGAFKRRIEKK